MTGSAYASGGGGTTLEHRYGAVLLVGLLTGSRRDEFAGGAALTSVTLQAAADSPIDDFLLGGRRPDGLDVIAAVAVRRTPKVRMSDPKTVELIGRLIKALTTHQDLYDEGRLSLVLAGAPGNDHLAQLSDLAAAAAVSPEPSQLRDQLRRAGSGRAHLERLEQLEQIIAEQSTGAPPTELAWRLLRVLQVIYLQLENAAQADRHRAIEQLTHLTEVTGPVAAAAVFDRLIDLAGSFAVLGARVDQGLLRSFLRWPAQGGTATSASPLPTREEHLGVVLQERRRLLRGALGLDSSAIDRSFGIEPPLPPALGELVAGELLVIRGPLGSGKSDLALRWLLKHAPEGDSDRQRVWLRADEISQTLGAAVLQQLEPGASLTAVDLVLDGSDERTTGNRLLEEARLLVRTVPTCRVVVTTRDRVLSVESRTVLEVEPWDRDLASELIAAVRDESVLHVRHRFEEPVWEALQRPLFALIAAADNGPATTGNLTTLIAGAVRNLVPNAQERRLLEELAIAIVRRGRPVDPRVEGLELGPLGGSPLLETTEGRTRFTLASFQQWFAAQGLLYGRISMSEVTISAEAFGRWRYVIAVAAGGPFERVDRLLESLTTWNPGATAWVLKQATAGSAAVRTADRSALQELSVSSWTALQAFEKGMAPLAPLLGPFRLSRTEPATSGLQVVVGGASGGRAAIAVRPRPAPAAPDTDVLPRQPTGPQHSTIGTLQDENDPWRWMLRQVMSDAGDLLQTSAVHQLFVPDEGVVATEYRSWLACTVAGVNEQAAGWLLPLRLEHVLSEAARLLEVSAMNPDGWVQVGNRGLVTSLTLERLLEALSQEGEEVYADRWPGPDIARGATDRFLHYTTPRVEERVSAVLVGACRAYLELADGMLPQFGDLLAHRAVLPAVLHLAVRHDPVGHIGDFGDTTLHYWLEPMAPHDPVDPPIRLSFDVSADEGGWSDYELERLGAASALRERLDVNPFAEASLRAQIMDPSLFGRRPATTLAVQWLIEDLKKLELLPQSVGLVQLR